MITATLEDARLQLAELISAATQGEEVVISQAGKPVARLLSYQLPAGPRQGGQWRGRVHIAPDFDELPQDIAEAFGAHEPTA